jgi:very-short-patch-repair endonuclease
MTSQSASESTLGPFVFEGKTYRPTVGGWKTNEEGFRRLVAAKRIMARANSLAYVRYLDDFPVTLVANLWMDVRWGFDAIQKAYVVQTHSNIIARCLLMTTDPGDLVFDPTCGSGTTAYVAEQWGRRWITCDTSRVALTLARQRLMTAVFDYYELAYPSEGVGSGFKYKTVPHVTLKSIANNPEIDGIYARMHPAIERALAALNQALTPTLSPWERVAEGRVRGEPLSQGERVAEGRVRDEPLQEWEVPFEFPAGWPQEARKPFDEFHAARRAMQKAMDEAIARHAPQETLYDQPFVDRKKVRVTGPFTVEAVPAPAVKSVEEFLPSPDGRGAGGEGKKPLDPELLEFARRLRAKQTDAERLLWSLLRNRRFMGYKFRRQHPMEPYVLDFYCHECHLAIELDGGQHNEPATRARDEKRTAFLQAQGIRVLRFWNNEVLTNLEGVLQAIHDALTPTLSQGEREFGADTSIARSGETLRQSEWRDELRRAGIRGKAGQHIRFARLEPLPGCRWLHADGETRPSDEGADSVRERGPAYLPQRIVVSFGPEHAPLEQRQVAQAIEEAQTLAPRPKLIVFAAFQFDPEAAKDIDETNWPGVTLLKAQMNADLLTDDLKKKRASNESFWLIGQPDVQVERIAPSPQPSPSGRGSKGELSTVTAPLAPWPQPSPSGRGSKGELSTVTAPLAPWPQPSPSGRGWREAPGEGVQYRVSVHGFDYYNTKTGGIESGGADKIAVWLLDTDYDGRSLYPRQVFFPMAGANEGWARLAKNLKAEIDEELIEAYRGTVSLPFAAGEHKRIAVKIVDDRGIESLKVMMLPE